MVLTLVLKIHFIFMKYNLLNNTVYLLSFSTILVEPNCTASITKYGDIEIQVDHFIFLSHLQH